jgi:hypothetical protein
LVDNYIDRYIPFVRSEIERTINDFSTDALDTINIAGVFARLRGLLPNITELDRVKMAELQPNRLTEQLLTLAYENEEKGLNIQQLLQAMGRFLPLLATVPNLGSLASRRTGQLPARDNARREYLVQVEEFYNDFLAQQIDPTQRTKIWQEAEEKLLQAFGQFSVDGLTIKNAASRQLRFRLAVDAAVRELLLTSLSALDGDQLVAALRSYITKQQNKWRERDWRGGVSELPAAAASGRD